MNVTSQLDSLRELSGAKSWYEETLGWPVSLDVGHQRLIMQTGHDVDAVTMPARIGVVVLAQLRIALMAGPVLAAPGGQWQTFLTTPARASHPVASPDLRRARVQYVPKGGQVVIPSGQDNDLWQWVEAPRPWCVLPSWSAVIVATKLAVSAE